MSRNDTLDQRMTLEIFNISLYNLHHSDYLPDLIDFSPLRDLYLLQPQTAVNSTRYLCLYYILERRTLSSTSDAPG